MTLNYTDNELSLDEGDEIVFEDKYKLRFENGKYLFEDIDSGDAAVWSPQGIESSVSVDEIIVDGNNIVDAENNRIESANEAKFVSGLTIDDYAQLNSIVTAQLNELSLRTEKLNHKIGLQSLDFESGVVDILTDQETIHETTGSVAVNTTIGTASLIDLSFEKSVIPGGTDQQIFGDTNSDYFVTSDYDGNTYVYDSTGGEITQVGTISLNGRLYSFSTDGTYLIFGTGNSEVQVYDAGNITELATLSSMSNDVGWTALSADSSRLFVGSDKLYEFDTSDWSYTYAIGQNDTNLWSSNIDQYGASADSTNCIFNNERDMLMYDATEQSVTKLSDSVQDYPDQISSLKSSGLITQQHNGFVVFRDGSTGEVVQRMEGPGRSRTNKHENYFVYRRAGEYVRGVRSIDTGELITQVDHSFGPNEHIVANEFIVFERSNEDGVDIYNFNVGGSGSIAFEYTLGSINALMLTYDGHIPSSCDMSFSVVDLNGNRIPISPNDRKSVSSLQTDTVRIEVDLNSSNSKTPVLTGLSLYTI